MIVDITQTTKIGRVYRDGSPALKVENIKCNEGTKSEYETIMFSCATHNMGTHIDVVDKDVFIENERLISMGIKFDVSHISERTIKLSDIDTSIVEEGQYVFFQTNWDKYFDDEDKYNNHPEIDFEVIEFLASKKVNMIGIDTLGLGRGKNHGKIDVYLAKEGRYAIENLCNLDQIPSKDFKVYCLPTKIEGLDVFPTRILVEY